MINSLKKPKNRKLKDPRLSEIEKKPCQKIPSRTGLTSSKALVDFSKSPNTSIKPISKITSRPLISSPDLQLKSSTKKPLDSISKETVTPKSIVPSKDLSANTLKEPNLKSVQKSSSKKQSSKKPTFEARKFLNQVKNNSHQAKFFPVLSNSQKSLLKSFSQEYEKTIKKIDQSGSGLLNYSSFCKALNSLNLITNPITKGEEETNCVLKAWKILGGLDDQKVLIEDLHLFLLAVLGLPLKLPSAPGKGKKSIWAMSSKEIQGVSSEFALFVKIRKNDFKIAKKETTSEDFSYEEIEVGLNILNDLSEQYYVPALSLMHDSISGVVKQFSLREMNSVSDY